MRKLLVRLRTRLRNWVVDLRVELLRRIWGMDIGKGARISLKAQLDKTNPRGIHIGIDSYISPHAMVLTHDFINTRHLDTWIGCHCFVGAKAIIMPGVRIGDHCIVAAGSVVVRDVPSGSLVAGNPATIKKQGLHLGPWGIRNWDGIR